MSVDYADGFPIYSNFLLFSINDKELMLLQLKNWSNKNLPFWKS